MSKNFGKKTASLKQKKEILAFIMDHHIAIVATAHDNMPFASVVYYVADKDFNIYFATKRVTGKYQNIVANGKITFVVPTTKQASVTGIGKGVMLYGAEKEKILKKINDNLEKNKITESPLNKLKHLNQKDKPVHSSMVVCKIISKHISFVNLNHDGYPTTISDEVTKIDL